MKVRCPGCRAEPRMVGTVEGRDSMTKKYRCFYKGCRFYGKVVAEKTCERKAEEPKGEEKML